MIVAIETCDTLRPHSTSNNLASSYASGGHYGFSDKVIDGLTVTVKSVHVTFRSPIFRAVFQVGCLYSLRDYLHNILQKKMHGTRKEKKKCHNPPWCTMNEFIQVKLYKKSS